uniref:Uncharacterized protein n=1 Tax=Anguilla anguilla TaxID=7936 RepID=A0A0E9WUX6_ANGAN
MKYVPELNIEIIFFSYLFLFLLDLKQIDIPFNCFFPSLNLIYIISKRGSFWAPVQTNFCYGGGNSQYG